MRNSPDDPHKSLRQQVFLRALRTLPFFFIYESNFSPKTKKYPLAPARAWDDPEDPEIVFLREEGPVWAVVRHMEEKGSDVNLATMLLADAFGERFEVAAVFSNDSDLLLPIRIVTQELGLPVGLISPRKNHAAKLAEVATFKRAVHRKLLRECQFPDEITDEHGTIRKPEAWSS